MELETKQTSQKILPVILIIILIFLTILTARYYWQSFLDIQDSLGYWFASQQLANGEGLVYVNELNRPGKAFYTLHTFKVFRSNTYHRSFDYPPGLPILGALWLNLFHSLSLLTWLIPILGGIVVLLSTLIGRVWHSWWVGLYAGLILATNTTFLEFGTAFWSEIPSSFFLYGGLLFYIVALKDEKQSAKTTPYFALVGGFLLSLSIFFRFANITILALFFGFLALSYFLNYLRLNLKTIPRKPTLWAVAGLFLGLSLVLAYNTFYYGAPFQTSYTPLHGWYEQPAFALEYSFAPSFIGGGGYSTMALLNTFIEDFGLFLLVAVCASLLFFQRVHFLLWLLIFVLCIPYAFYAFPAAGVNKRFVLTAWPAMALLIGHGLTVLPGYFFTWWNAPRYFLGTRLFLLAVLLIWSLPTAVGYLPQLNHRNQTAADRVNYVLQLLEPTEPNAVILAYTQNDIVVLYGQRTTLNYRYMIPYSQAENRYFYEDFAHLLVEEINYLLEQNRPVYYHYDKEPSLYNSYEILTQHFTLQEVYPALYKVEFVTQ